MRTEYTRQTRWGHDPEAVDPVRVPPGTAYVKQVIWVACSECDLQVHATVTQSLASGVTCPECGQRLAASQIIGDLDAVERVAGEEEHFRQQIEGEEIPCSDSSPRSAS